MVGRGGAGQVSVFPYKRCSVILKISPPSADGRTDVLPRREERRMPPASEMLNDPSNAEVMANAIKFVGVLVAGALAFVGTVFAVKKK